MTNTCFVIMPIGTQKVGDTSISSNDLKKKYDYIIKNAIRQADPSLEVIRADEEVNPGSISNDIFTKLMHSKYVIADITYPNPNVFYELGIRHAISSRTILIRESDANSIPFDISHLRYISYTQDPGGMEELSSKLKAQFDFYDSNPGKLDNQFLELCKFTDFVPEVYRNPKSAQKELMSSLIMFMFSRPQLTKSLVGAKSKEEQSKILMNAFTENPSDFLPLFQSLLTAGIG